MALSTSYSTINALGDIPIIGGSTYTIKFTVTNQTGSAINLSTAVCSMILAEYGTNNEILTKTGSVTSANIFEVVLSSDDTIELSGKYAYQPKITFSNGVVVVPSQGIITISQGF